MLSFAACQIKTFSFQTIPRLFWLFGIQQLQIELAFSNNLVTLRRLLHYGKVYFLIASVVALKYKN